MFNLTTKSDVSQVETLDLIRNLHRAPGAKVAFLAPDSQGKLKTLGACSIDELDQHAELIQSYTNGPLYFTLNSVASGNGTTATGLQWALTHDRDTRHLNAVWVDLDVGRPEAIGVASLSVSEALQGITDATHEGTIPQPSLIVESGRGVWILWLLHDRDDESQPPRAHDSNINRHRAICTELARRLEHLGADANSINAARVCRVPGSMNCKSLQRVKWHLLREGPESPVFSYSLDQLGAELGTGSKPARRPRGAFYGRAIKNRGSAPNRRRGKVERARRRCTDIEQLSRARGGFELGHRWHALTAYAHLLRAADEPAEQIALKVETLAAACRPPFPSETSDGTTSQIVSDATDRNQQERNYSEAELVKRFKVTSTDARRLKLRSILPEPVRAEQEAERRANNRTGQREARLTALRAIVGASPTASAAECRAELIGQGIEASAATVKRDLNAIAPERQRAEAGRPPIEPGQLLTAAQPTKQRNELHPPLLANVLSQFFLSRSRCRANRSTHSRMRAALAVLETLGVHYFVKKGSKRPKIPFTMNTAYKTMKIRPNIARMNNIPSSCFFIVLIVCAALRLPRLLPKVPASHLCAAGTFGVHYFVKKSPQRPQSCHAHIAAHKTTQLITHTRRKNDFRRFTMFIVCATLFFQSQNALYN